MRHNGDRRPEEIEAEIARTRGDMDATLTAIEHRLTPGQLIDQGLDYLRGSGANEFVSNLGGSVKNNPIPVALMGIGMAWLMATGNRRPAYLERSGESAGPGAMQRASEGMSSKMSGMSSSVSSTMSSTKDRLSQTSQAARERVGQLGQTARSQMERVRSQADHLRSRYDSMVREQPLVLGAIGLAVGAMVAAGLPRTREEDQLMGEARDRLTEKAKEVGQEQMGKVQQVATAAKDAAIGAAEKQQKQGRDDSSKQGKDDSRKQGSTSAQTSTPAGRPNVIEPARATPLGDTVKPKDPRLGTP
ncbi:MAG TPA: DUF3618 domain-containing protein [Burkholderiales bacterium]|nr:DUF3618 domain-containing protein [Burkholderiales bacterium]